MTTLKAAADALDVVALSQATELAAALSCPFPVAWDKLAAEFIRRAKERGGSALSDADGRQAKWRVRVRLYTAERPDEPEADSDADLAADKPGATIIAGLPSVAEHLAILATTFHAQPCLGLEPDILLHRLKSLRPTISRRGGDAVWRVPYSIASRGQWEPNDLRAKQNWLARVDVERVA